jgi:hypothetical protein
MTLSSDSTSAGTAALTTILSPAPGSTIDSSATVATEVATAAEPPPPFCGAPPDFTGARPA